MDGNHVNGNMWMANGCMNITNEWKKFGWKMDEWHFWMDVKWMTNEWIKCMGNYWMKIMDEWMTSENPKP